MKHFIITIFLAHFLLTAFAQNDIIIQASDIQVNAGDEITYPITVNPNGNTVGSFDFEIEYNNNLFEILGAEGTDGWSVFSNPIAPGIVKVAGFKIGGQSTTFDAVNLTFNAIGQAGQTGAVQLNVELVGDNDGQDLNYQSFDGSIAINGSCRYNDSLALVAVYDALNGDNWYSWYKWDLNQPMDNWYGVTLNENGCVAVLDLDEKGISGTLAPEIGDLSELTVLNFAENGISGSLPVSIGNLANLETLILSQNQLTGNIPSTIGDLTNLTYLSLSSNQLTGSIPSTIGDLTNLTGLILSGNNLTGSIPSTIGSLTQLTSLNLNGNQLSAGIPSTIGNLASLKYLYLHNNQLSGAVPSGIGNLSNVSFLYLSNNQLTSLPASINNLTNLTNFIASDNLFTSLPDMGNLDKLRSLQFNNNQISGSMPEWLVDMDDLLVLRLQNNQMSGCYASNLTQLCDQLSWYGTNGSISDGNNFDAPWEDFCNTGAGDCTPQITCRQRDSLALIAVYDALNGDDWYQYYQWDFAQPMDTWRGVTLNANGCVDFLGIDEAGITGTLAPEIGDLSELTRLDFAENNISGTLPSSIGNLTNLESLSLSQNRLTGNIPSSIGNLTKLTVLSLSSNDLSGAIPSSISNLSNLTTLSLSNNNFSSIPSTIGGLNAVKYIYLNNNNIGNFPSSIGDLTNLERLYLSNNNIGGIPSTIGNLSNLKYLYLSDNNLGGINAGVGNLTNLIGLYLDHNNLGGINPAIGNLTNLKYLYLNNNNLGGVNAAVGNLSNLISLHLNDNQIGGNMPEWLEDMASLSSLRINNNQMSGCYSLELLELCSQLSYWSNRNQYISDGNNFDIPWESFCANSSCSSDACGDDANTLLLLPFDNTLNGIAGETPATSAHLSYTTGTYNEALNVLAQSDTPLLRYPASGNINSQAGTVEAWVKPMWNGNDGVARTILQYGGGGGILITKDGANNLRLILNRFSLPGYPEVGVGYNISDWQAGQWKHVAFTWEQNGTSKLYINGELLAHENHNVTLFPISDAEFSVGMEVSYFHWQGAIDHFRISNVARSQSEIINFRDNCIGTKVVDNQAIDTYNFPNPFSNQTTITYTLPEDSPVTLTVYDGVGRQVALLHQDEIQSAGTYTVNFEGGTHPAGIYYYTIKAGAYSGTQKMVLMK